ncbi:HAD-IIB family hydrolase [bacterium SCSIO 12741]|nr:HAD-IIB family hydrolase [bacterium SCSIO 12741]
MNGQLFITDLDGTLLNPEGKLSDYSYSALKDLLDDGMPISVASARSLHTMKQILGDLPIQIPVVCINGAYICDFAQHRYLAIQGFPSAIKAGLLNYMQERSLGLFVSAFIDEQELLYYHKLTNQGQLWYLNDRIKAKDHRLRETQDLSPFYEEQVVSMTLMDDRAPLEQVQSDLRQQFGDLLNLNLTENLYEPKSWWLTIHFHRANKAEGINYLLEQGFGNQKNLTVFGDELNDLKMFALSNQAIAVSNANPALIKKAHRVIGSNDDNSVVRYLQEIWKK